MICSRKYIIYDVDEFSALQKYFLKSCGLRIDNAIHNEYNISLIFNIAPFEKLLKCYDKRINNKCFIATWSLSETPIELRNKVLNNLPEFECYLFAYQKKFGEVNNIKYFKDFITKKKHYKYKIWEIPHLKDNYYLIGVHEKLLK